MDKLLSRIKALLPDIIFVILMASCISLALNSSLLINVSYFKILQITVFMTIMLLIIFWNAITVLAAFSIISSGLVVFISFFDKSHITSKIIYFTIDAFIRVYNYITVEGDISGLENLITMFISCVITLIMFFFILKLRLYYFSILSGSAFFAIWSINGFTVEYASFYIFTLTMILIYLYAVKSGKGKGNGQIAIANTQFLLSVIPIALIIFIMSYLMPSYKDPIQVPWLDSKVARLSNYITNAYEEYRYKNDFFSLNQMGFGDDDTVGGSVTSDSTEVLEVKTSKPVYLKAIGKDLYTGSGWKDSYTERKELMDSEGYAADELIETNFGLKLLNRQNQYSFDDLFQVNKLEISFLNLRTKSIFIPKGLISINAPDTIITANNNITTSAETLKKKGYRYEVIAQSPKYESEVYNQLLLNSYNGLYRSLLRRQQSIPWQWDDNRLQMQGSLYMSSFNKYIKLADYAVKADRIRSTYTVLPKELPQRVKDLAIKLTESKRTNYEKARAIEKYLSDNFPYTLQPGATPSDRDFVDYFLFEQKQGYCVHYASAMVVMARAAGLPARYVEGFRMASSADSSEDYIITNQSAHSWVEIYFEGAGWVPFEPTAPYNSDFYKREAVTTTDTEEITPDEEEATTEPKDLLTEDDTVGGTDTQGPSRFASIMLKTAIIIVVIIALGLIITVINFERRRHKIKKYKKLPSSNAMVRLYEELLYIMRKAGYGILDNETAIQYGKRIDGMFYIRPVSFEKISMTFTEARYGARQIDISKVEEYDKVYTCLLGIFIKEKGKLLYIINHYFLGSI